MVTERRGSAEDIVTKQTASVMFVTPTAIATKQRHRQARQCTNCAAVQMVSHMPGAAGWTQNKKPASGESLHPNATIVVDAVVRLLLCGRVAGGCCRRYVPAGMAVCRALLHSRRFLFEFFPRSGAPSAAWTGGRVAGRRQSGRDPAVRAGANRISIFLNIFDVHVNRTPIPGKVTCVNYKKGQFLAANKADASDANEQNILTVEGVVGGVHTT